jgi:hypothetical protein
MIELLKDWVKDPRNKARTEAEIAIEELRSEHFHFKDDLPQEIREMMKGVLSDERTKSLYCLTPMKVRLEVRAD